MSLGPISPQFNPARFNPVRFGAAAPPPNPAPQPQPQVQPSGQSRRRGGFSTVVLLLLSGIGIGAVANNSGCRNKAIYTARHFSLPPEKAPLTTSQQEYEPGPLIKIPEHEKAEKDRAAALAAEKAKADAAAAAAKPPAPPPKPFWINSPADFDPQYGDDHNPDATTVKGQLIYNRAANTLTFRYTPEAPVDDSDDNSPENVDSETNTNPPPLTPKEVTLLFDPRCIAAPNNTPEYAQKQSQYWSDEAKNKAGVSDVTVTFYESNHRSNNNPNESNIGLVKNMAGP